jgi:hypothetical protein
MWLFFDRWLPFGKHISIFPHILMLLVIFIVGDDVTDPRKAPCRQ